MPEYVPGSAGVATTDVIYDMAVENGLIGIDREMFRALVKKVNMAVADEMAVFGKIRLPYRLGDIKMMQYDVCRCIVDVNGAAHLIDASIHGGRVSLSRTAWRSYDFIMNPRDRGTVFCVRPDYPSRSTEGLMKMYYFRASDYMKRCVIHPAINDGTIVAYKPRVKRLNNREL